MSLSYSERTKYNNKYKKVYWGRFKGDNPSDEIIENRNKFVPMYDIKSHKKLSRKLDQYFKLSNDKYDILRDHFESYLLKREAYDPYKILGLFSIYDTSDETADRILKDGYMEIFKLYSDSARTFMKIIEFKTLRRIT
jgi:hypothetical protein